MINIKPQVYKALCNACPNASVSDEYPVEWKTFPKVTYSEENNATSAYYDDDEQFSRIVFKIDVFDKRNTFPVVQKVNEAMKSLGFQRTSSIDNPNTENYKHKIMRYEAEIDEKTLAVYHY